MEKKLTVDTVSKFLRENPEFLNNWLSSRGLSELADERKGKAPAYVIGNAFVSYVQDIVQKKRIPPAKIIYNEVNKNDLFKQLCRDIADELDVNVLCHKILQNVCLLTRSDRASLFLVRRSATEQYLISKLFDVTTTSAIEESLVSPRDAIRIPFGEGIVGTVAETRQPINIKNAYKDPRFNKEVDIITGYHTRCIMSSPIFGLDEEVVGVACVINKLEGDCFTASDEKLFKDYLAFCGIGINNAQLFEIKVEEFKRNQLLLHLVKQITTKLPNLKQLVEVILQQALNMLECKCVSVYLLDDSIDTSTKFSNVFEMWKCKNEIVDCTNDQKFNALARKCIKSGEVMYTPTIFDLANSSVDADDLFCINIMNACSVIIGCIIFDREAKDTFSRTDVEMMETFALFCGIGVQNSKNYELALKSETQKEIALDLLANHCAAPAEELNRLLSLEMLTVEKLCIYRFDFNDMALNEDETVLACAQLFIETRTLELLDIPIDLLFVWILTVKKNYRSVIYHNWRHGLNVAQTMFCMLTTGKMRTLFSDNDCVYLMVASLCHDLDHRGTNNAFQVKVASPLATLYSTSVMEHHHIDHCLMILNSKGTDIFRNLPAEEYKHALKMVEHAILSTDLVLYFEKRNQFKHLVENGEKTFATDQQKDLLLSMMMTACDLSAITKPWKVQRKVALIVAREFYYQGDMEKELAGTVIPLMDRDKRHDLPKMQVSFIDFVCVMVYRYLSEMNELLTPLYTGCLANRENWGKVAAGEVKFNVDKRMRKQEKSEAFFLEEFSDDEIDEEKEIDEDQKESQENGEGKEAAVVAGEEEKKKKEEEKKKAEEEKKKKEEEEKKKEEEEKKKLEDEKKKVVERQQKGEEEETKKKEEEKQKEKEEENRKNKQREEEERREKEENEKRKKEEEEQEKKKKEEDEKKKKEKDEEEKKKKEKDEEEKKKKEEEKKKKEEEEKKKKKKKEEEEKQEGEASKPTDDADGSLETRPELKPRRTYRQPSNAKMSLHRQSTRTCYDDIAEANQSRANKKKTVYKPTEEVVPLIIKRKSTVVVPPNPNTLRSVQLEESNVSLETQKLRRLSTFNDYASSSSMSEEEEGSEATSSKLGNKSKMPGRKLTGRSSRFKTPSLNNDPGPSSIIEEDPDKDILPDMQRQITRRLTGPQTRYVANNDRPKKYISK